ncbi:MAG TPA: NAD(P)-dependent oxidoreductase [Gammaproteobacteria bacterium]
MAVGVTGAEKDVVLITGSSGHIASALIERLGDDYALVGADRPGLPVHGGLARYVPMDLTSDESVELGIADIRRKFGGRLAAVFHLAAYYNFTGDPDPRYETVNVLGTERLLGHLQTLEVDRFIFSSSMLVHEPTEPGRPIRENGPLNPAWNYPQSKLDAEERIRQSHGEIAYVILRIAGVYDDEGGLPALAQQIQRIYERKLIGRVFPGDSSRGQAAIHLDDLATLFALLIEKRNTLPDGLVLLAGEPETVSYATLQYELGRLIHGEPWETREIPKSLAKTGAWLEEVALPKEKEPFIKHWMIDIADDHYELDISKARMLLGWQPKHHMLKTLPKIIEALRRDPARWYKRHKLDYPGR